MKKLTWGHSTNEGHSWDSNPHAGSLHLSPLTTPSSRSCPTRSAVSGSEAFLQSLRYAARRFFLGTSTSFFEAVWHFSKLAFAHLPVHSPGVCAHPGDRATICLTHSTAHPPTGKIQPRDPESPALPYRPSAAGVTSTDRGAAVVETAVARGSHLLDSWVTPGTSGATEGTSFPSSVSPSPLPTWRGDTCGSCVTQEKVAAASATAVVGSGLRVS